ncbi:hypothetical protein K402DRAFT_416148 [Aulographum hederae CBS 113979]|uniref:Uncharacterized protein n=1 Tax=Aulographum hederae CBS 113979 TaxID=1176131 RepID=A0A6G1HHD6_9PEZI|nr:hypothetical protein K402DRAFT_416148 [Aulographum hederae CBS 113979]
MSSPSPDSPDPSTTKSKPKSKSKTITRPPPTSVIYDLTHPTETTITLPEGSTWTSGLHWHERHREELEVVRGAVWVRVGGGERAVGAVGEGDGVVKVGRGVVHEWRRAKGVEGDVVVRERSFCVGEGVGEEDEPDVGKSVFFWNVNGIILTTSSSDNSSTTSNQSFITQRLLPRALFSKMGEYTTLLHLFILFHELDNYPVFLDLSLIQSSLSGNVGRTIERLLTYFILGLAAVVGRVFGLEGVREEFMPRDLGGVWRERGRMRRRMGRGKME